MFYVSAGHYLLSSRCILASSSNLIINAQKPPVLLIIIVPLFSLFFFFLFFSFFWFLYDTRMFSREIIRHVGRKRRVSPRFDAVAAQVSPNRTGCTCIVIEVSRHHDRHLRAQTIFDIITSPQDRSNIFEVFPPKRVRAAFVKESRLQVIARCVDP